MIFIGGWDLRKSVFLNIFGRNMNYFEENFVNIY